MKKLIPILFIFFTVSYGYSDSTQINLNLSKPPSAGIKQIIIGSSLIAVSAVSLAASIYIYNDWKKPQVGWCGTGKAMQETEIEMYSFLCIASAISGTIFIRKGIKKRRYYFEWKLGQNQK